MTRLLTIMLSIIILSCGDETIVHTNEECSSDACPGLWICWNPESPEHGKACSDKCMEKGDNTKYCYFQPGCIQK